MCCPTMRSPEAREIGLPQSAEANRLRPLRYPPGIRDNIKNSGVIAGIMRNTDAMLRRPDPRRNDLSYIWRYAIGIDGYAYAKKHFSTDCGDLANRRLEGYERTTKWEGTFEELRCCLFFEQRRYHHFGWNPKGKELKAIKSLYRSLCDLWTSAHAQRRKSPHDRVAT